MNISRITSITPDGEFDSANGHMWAFIVAFEDGTQGQANAKSATPPYRIGDSVGYDTKGQTPRGVTKLKIDRKAGQTVGTAPPQRQAQAPRTQTAPITVGANDEQAFHNTMKKLCLLRMHCHNYARRFEQRHADLGLGLLSADEKRDLITSLWITAKDAGLAQHPPKLEAQTDAPPTTTQRPPAPAPVQRTEQRNVSEPVPANGGDEDDSSVPF